MPDNIGSTSKKLKKDNEINNGITEDSMDTTEKQDHTNNKQPKMNEEETNKYLTSDRGPFFVILEKPGLNLIQSARTLNKANFKDILDIRESGRNRVRVQFKNSYAANKLLNTKLFESDKELKIFAPKMFTQSIGVITSIPGDMDMEELKNNSYAECNIIKMERITKWDPATQQANPTTAVKIWFRQNILPKSIQVYFASVRVRYYIPNPIICKNCLRYGHTKNVCKIKQQTCHNCATIHETNIICPNNTTCKYCKENHKTTDRNCKEYQKQKQVKRIMTIKKVTYQQALREVNDSGIFPVRTPVNSNINENNNYKEQLGKLNLEVMETKKNLITCQETLNSIHQITSNFGEDNHTTNDAMLIEILNVLRGAAKASSTG